MKNALFFCSLFIVAFLHAQQQRPVCHHRHAPYTHHNTQPAATNERSDTLNVLHYMIHLNMTDFTTNTIAGYTDVQLTPLMNNITTVSLDLLELTVDSVTLNQQSINYSYNDTLIIASLPNAINVSDTIQLRVYYHGNPQTDASGWGGFYYSSGYAFNLGVGFDANPHNYGRVWFPCFDNFVERSKYTFHIGTNNNRIAYCNGTLTSDTTDANSVRWRTWYMNEEIPTYLASVAVAPYTQVNWTHNGVNGPIPIVLTALPADTTGMKNSFVHLPDAIDAFEARYYQHMWNRVGFCLVPFSSGAMEHATNIAYPRLAANGSLTYETLMAHELSHHWFGDLATCRTAEDMWLNEGWASYSEYLFLEWVYGINNYRAGILANHDDVVHFAHLRENGFRAVSGVPHNYTYGDHVYLKGADVAHTLRGYMGDSLFFAGLRYHLSQSEYKDVSSADFRDNLITATGLTYLNDFFNDWVFNGGFPQFSTDSVTALPVGNSFDVTVYVKQKLRGAPNYFTNVPLDFTFFSANGDTINERRFVSGPLATFTTSLPFQPVYTAVDFNEKISDAISDEHRVIGATGQFVYTHARCTLTVNNISDTALVRIEHNWVAPDTIKNNVNNFRISSERYWNIDGVLPTTFYAKARLYYDGRTTSTAGPSQWLDHDLMPVNQDSIILLYRRNAADDWREWPYYTKTRIGSATTSKYGYVEVDSLALGQYTFACGVSSVVGLQEESLVDNGFVIYPNPANEQVVITNSDPAVRTETVEILDALGLLVLSAQVNASTSVISVAALPTGMYFVRITTNQGVELKKLNIVR